MIGWNPGYDWTKEETTEVINNAVAKGEKTINLDMEHSSAVGISRVMGWIREMGYSPVNNERHESIYVELKKREGDKE